MRKIYRNQNLRLGAENISEGAKGFFSRLRVDVRPNHSETDEVDSVRDVDLVFLHDVISHHALPTWSEEAGGSEILDETFDITLARRPRQRIMESNATGVGIYLTLPCPPRTVADYQNLLYELSKKGFLSEDCHGVLIRQVKFADPEVKEIISRSHNLAEWVITYDKVASRTLLERCGVQIISDISLPRSDGRVILSARTVNDQLKQKIQEVLKESCGVSEDRSLQFTEAVVGDVLKISGSKVLSAARYTNTAREMIGLAIMRAWIEAAIRASLSLKNAPIWLSLDDHRSWFMSGSGKVADAIAVSIGNRGEDFEIFLCVGEAKFVERETEHATLKDARQQVCDTVNRLKNLFIDSCDEISRTASCARLFELLINRDGINEMLP